MGKITFVLSDELEKRLRMVAQRKGDLSKIAESAIDYWLSTRGDAVILMKANYRKEEETSVE